MSPPNHEFSHEENKQVQALATSLRRFMVPLTVFSLLQFAMAGWVHMLHRPDWGPVLYLVSGFVGLVALALGALARRAATDFQLIVDTEGADIEHLMAALARIRKSVLLCLPLAVLLAMLLFGQLLYTVGSNPPA